MSETQSHEILETFDRQEVSWLTATVSRAKQVKTVAGNIEKHLANVLRQPDVKDTFTEHEIKTVLEFARVLIMMADEDIRVGEEQLKNN